MFPASARLQPPDDPIHPQPPDDPIHPQPPGDRGSGTARVAGSVNERKRAAMDSDVFDGLCRALGYQPDSVLSIRVNPREVVLVHVDATGDLRRAIHRIGDVRRQRSAPPLGVMPSGRVGETAPRCAE
jgi:hypothetical protein